MPKIFSRTNSFYWKTLSGKVPSDTEVYDIQTRPSFDHFPSGGNQEMTKSHTIICHESHEIWRMGLAMFSWEYKDTEMSAFSDRISQHISENDDIIIIFEEDIVNGYPFYNYFVDLKKKLSFHLHAVFITYTRLREIQDDTSFLRIIPFVNNCDSVTVFNIAEWHELMDNAENWIVPQHCTKDDQEALTMINDLFEDALAEIIRTQDYSVLHPDNQSVYVYSHSSASFEKHVLQHNEIVDPSLYNHAPEEFITPNSGKDTCRYLRKLRSQYVKKHLIKHKEHSCTYNGICQGTCQSCDITSQSLWNHTHNNPARSSDNISDLYSVSAEICGINRLRLGTDGNGVRSLVVFDKCPLSCKYCINRATVNQLPGIHKTSVVNLFEMVKKDLVYFEVTNGGITFGGGEPLLYADFIAAFKRAFPFIHIAVQTSLNVSYYAVEMLFSLVDAWYIDIKDMNPRIYRAYTGQDHYKMIENLKMLAASVSKKNIYCRVPIIPDYNTTSDVRYSVDELKKIGITNVEVFGYIV